MHSSCRFINKIIGFAEVVFIVAFQCPKVGAKVDFFDEVVGFVVNIYDVTR